MGSPSTHNESSFDPSSKNHRLSTSEKSIKLQKQLGILYIDLRTCWYFHSLSNFGGSICCTCLKVLFRLCSIIFVDVMQSKGNAWLPKKRNLNLVLECHVSKNRGNLQGNKKNKERQLLGGNVGFRPQDIFVVFFECCLFFLVYFF